MNIVFLAHGSVTSYKQVIFCILTLSFYLKGDFKNLQIIIYTDNAKLFHKYLHTVPYKIEIITKNQMKIYMGPQKYVHRIKPCIFIDYFTKYKSDLFYIDGDTFFLKDPRPLLLKIKKGVSIMNVNESDLIEAGSLEHIDWFNLRMAVKNNKFLLNNEEVSIPLTTRIWNSGVTGLSYEDAGLLDSVLELTDQIYTKTSVFYVEQFALSYILQNNTALFDSENYITHYWEKINKKKMFDYYIHNFFKKNEGISIDVLAEKANELTMKYDQLIPKFIKTPFFEKIILRVKLVCRIAFKGYL